MSERGRRTTIAAFALAGVVIAAYLTWVHYRGVEPVCAAGHGCEVVQSSSYAELAGVPVALIGLLGYLAILGSLLVPGERGRLAGAVLAMTGFGFSAYLTYRELFTIKAICQWCIGSAAIMTALLVVTVAGLLRAREDEPGHAAEIPPARAAGHGRVGRPV